MPENYPKAKYKKAVEGQGDQHPHFTGVRHPYVSALVLNAEDEKALGREWVDHPSLVNVEPELREETKQEEATREAAEKKEEDAEDVQPSVKRGPGRPPKVKSEE